MPGTRAKDFSSGQVAKFTPGVPQASCRVLNSLLQVQLAELTISNYSKLFTGSQIIIISQEKNHTIYSKICPMSQ